MPKRLTPPRLLLAIETSCDETAASVVENGHRILSSPVSSQVKIHSQYGGVVPEIASRCHMEAISVVVSKALEDAGISLSDLDALAVTQGPGLIGSLVVGLSFAKALSVATGLSLTGVNHVHAHLFSPFLDDGVRPTFPFVGLVVSGGHTSLYLVRNYLFAEPLGHTRDDAAGEAFDKVAKLLGLGYPGGPIIGDLATRGDPKRFHLPRARLKDTPFDFSFSGLKTAVLNLVYRLKKERGSVPVEDVCASFQEAVVDVLVEKTLLAAHIHEVDHIAVTGGVAANKRLRERFVDMARQQELRVFLPPPSLCTDNGAMVGLVGYYQVSEGIVLGPDADAYSRLP